MNNTSDRLPFAFNINIPFISHPTHIHTSDILNIYLMLMGRAASTGRVNGEVPGAGAGGYLPKLGDGGGNIYEQNSVYVSDHDQGFLQNASWITSDNITYVNGGFPIWMNDDPTNAAYHARGAVTGYYHLAQWMMNYDGTGSTSLEMQSSESLYWNGRLMSTIQETQAVINMSIALTREELKAEIYAELLALNPGIVIPQ